MNYKEIIKQTEKQAKAKRNVEKAILKEKTAILRDFAKDILEFFLFIETSKDFRFSGDAHWYKGQPTKSLLTMTGINEDIPYPVRKVREEIEAGRTSIDIMTNSVDCHFGSVSIKFEIDDNYIPRVSYHTRYFSTIKDFVFTDKEEFVKSFTAFLIEQRKVV